MKFIDDDAFSRIIEACLERESHAASVVILCALTGARANEVLRLTGESITYERVRLVGGDGIELPEYVESSVDWADYKIAEVFQMKVKIKASKNGDDRVIPIDSKYHSRLKSLRERIRERGTKATLAWIVNDFSRSVDTAYEITRNWFNKLQLELFGEVRYSLHGFRHSLAVNALKDDVHILKIKKMLGHRSLDSTYQYLRALETESIMDEIPMLVNRSGRGRPRNLK